MLRDNLGGEQGHFFKSFYFEIIVDPQEVAKKGTRRSHERAFLLRKGCGKELEAENPRV